MVDVGPQLTRRPGGTPILVGGKRPWMLRLAARYADLWNTSWHGHPPPLAALLHRRGGAAEGRPAVATTVGVTLLPPSRMGERRDPAQALFGTAEGWLRDSGPTRPWASATRSAA